MKEWKQCSRKISSGPIPRAGGVKHTVWSQNWAAKGPIPPINDLLKYENYRDCFNYFQLNAPLPCFVQWTRKK